MTYENLVKEAKKAVKTIDLKTIKEHLAVEFDIEGKGEGAFYVEFSSTKVEVEPYEYYDHDFRVRTDANSAIAVLKGELDPVKACEDGVLTVEGNMNKLELLKEHLQPEVPVKTTKRATKAAAKKTTATAKKTTATTKKTTTTKSAATKSTTKKATATKKPVPKKVEKKPATKTK